MSATLYRGFQIFTVTADAAGQGGDLFGQEQHIVVTVETAEKNCVPRSFKPHLEFVGTEQQFSDYIEEAAYFFDDGLSQFVVGHSSASSFKANIKRKLQEAKPLNHLNLSQAGICKVKFTEQQANLLGRSIEMQLDTDDAVKKLVDHCLELRLASSEPAKYWYSQPRVCRY